MPEFSKNCTAVILGACGGIGAAILQQLACSNRLCTNYALRVNSGSQTTSTTLTIVPIKLAVYSQYAIDKSFSKVKAQTQEINFALDSLDAADWPIL